MADGGPRSENVCSSSTMQVAMRNRRSFLKGAARAGFAAATLRSSAMLVGDAAALPKPSRAVAAEPKPLIQPGEIRSQNGILRTTIAAAPGRVQLGDFAFPGLLYNGAYLPPLLRPRLGDTMRITFRNNLPDDPSNLHYHGMSVSPQGNSDNVFIHVHPGHQFEYEVRIPATGRQRPGLFWYHPHAAWRCCQTDFSAACPADLSSTVSKISFRSCRRCRKRFFLIKHAELGEDNEIISINGQLNPIVQIRPGEMQFWRIANIGATLLIKFRIEGMPLYAVATDGHPLSQPRKITELFLGPGERIDAIAIGPQAGKYAMRTIAFQNEAWKKPGPVQQLATVVSDGPGTATANTEAEVSQSACHGSAVDRRGSVRPDRSPPLVGIFEDARSACFHDQWARHGRKSGRPDRETRRHRGVDRRQQPISNITAFISIRPVSW